MIARLRMLAALVALLSLTLSLAGEGWAMACERSAPASAASAHAEHGSPATDEHQDRSTSPASCPMQVASGPGCAVTAMPVVASPTAPNAGEPVSMSVAVEQAPVSPQVSSLFRPPRR